MAPLAAVGVDNDFAPGQPAVSHGAADHKPAGGIDEVARVAVDHLPGNDFFDNLFDDRLAQFVVGYIRFVLG